MKPIGEHLEEARLQAALSQREVALAVGVDHKTISRWERSQRVPRADHVVTLARVYGRSADDLLGLNPDFAPHKRTLVQKRKLVAGWEGFAQ